jgi:parallel beta-helix repeat protein
VDRNLFSGGFLLVLLVGGLVFCCLLRFGAVHASREVTGIIDSDTVWRKADSPFNLTGPVLVGEGVRLEVEAGVTVNLNGYYIRVAGVLYARGSVSDKIYFVGDGGEPPNWAITFSETSVGWNGLVGSGSFLENVVVNSTHTGIYLEKVTPKINNCVISAYYAVDVFECSPVISNCVIEGAIGVHYASPTITGNVIRGSISAWDSSGKTVISNNTIVGGWQNENVSGVVCSDALVSGNVVYSFATAGITVDSIWGAHAVIEENLIMFNSVGINVSSRADPVIRYNTIANNSVGIEVNDGSLPVISYNNIQDNGEYSVYLLESALDVDAADNWWGTTDYYAVRESIFDFNDDFNLGNVTFVPFLTELEPTAPSIASAPEPTPAPTPSSSPASSPPSPFSDLEVAIFVLLVVIAGLLVAVLALLLKKRR